MKPLPLLIVLFFCSGILLLLQQQPQQQRLVRASFSGSSEIEIGVLSRQLLRKLHVVGGDPVLLPVLKALLQVHSAVDVIHECQWPASFAESRIQLPEGENNMQHGFLVSKNVAKWSMHDRYDLLDYKTLNTLLQTWGRELLHRPMDTQVVIATDKLALSRMSFYNYFFLDAPKFLMVLVHPFHYLPFDNRPWQRVLSSWIRVHDAARSAGMGLGPSKALFVRAEEMSYAPEATMAQVFRWLGLPEIDRETWQARVRRNTEAVKHVVYKASTAKRMIDMDVLKDDQLVLKKFAYPPLPSNALESELLALEMDLALHGYSLLPHPQASSICPHHDVCELLIKAGTLASESTHQKIKRQDEL